MLSTRSKIIIAILVAVGVFAAAIVVAIVIRKHSQSQSQSQSQSSMYACTLSGCALSSSGTYASIAACQAANPVCGLPYGCVQDVATGVSCVQTAGGYWGNDSTCGGFSCGTPPVCSSMTQCPGGNVACAAWNDGVGEIPNQQNYCCNNLTVTTCGGQSEYNMCTNQPPQNACLCGDNCASGICTAGICQ